MRINDDKPIRSNNKEKMFKKFFGVDRGKTSNFSVEDRCEDREY